MENNIHFLNTHIIKVLIISSSFSIYCTVIPYCILRIVVYHGCHSLGDRQSGSDGGVRFRRRTVQKRSSYLHVLAIMKNVDENRFVSVLGTYWNVMREC